MQNIVKNTDCTNHIKELWKVFAKEGKELFSYTIRGESEDEEECTKQLLAYENHCYPNTLREALQALEVARNHFEHCDPEFVDAAIFELNAAECRVDAVRRCAG